MILYTIYFHICRIATIYISLVLLFDLFISVIKKETLKDFNYTIHFPDIKNFRKKNGEEQA